MSESKHTPGPWIASKYSSVVGCPVVNQIGHVVCNTASAGTFESGKEEAEANAKLIASAPDMLDALKMIVNADDSYISAFDVKQTMLSIAKEAIAKASRKDAS